MNNKIYLELKLEIPMFVATITADEAVYAGVGSDVYTGEEDENSQTLNYLINEEFYKNESGLINRSNFFTITPMLIGIRV